MIRSRGVSVQAPFSFPPNNAAKQAPESKRGKQSQSTQPSRLTSAQSWRGQYPELVCAVVPAENATGVTDRYMPFVEYLGRELVNEAGEVREAVLARAEALMREVQA